jgi:hypothetical protein
MRVDAGVPSAFPAGARASGLFSLSGKDIAEPGELLLLVSVLVFSASHGIASVHNLPQGESE